MPDDRLKRPRGLPAVTPERAGDEAGEPGHPGVVWRPSPRKGIQRREDRLPRQPQPKPGVKRRNMPRFIDAGGIDDALARGMRVLIHAIKRRGGARRVFEPDPDPGSKPRAGGSMRYDPRKYGLARPIWDKRANGWRLYAPANVVRVEVVDPDTGETDDVRRFPGQKIERPEKHAKDATVETPRSISVRKDRWYPGGQSPIEGFAERILDQRRVLFGDDTDDMGLRGTFICVRLSEWIGDQYAKLPEDSSPRHITVLYLGKQTIQQARSVADELAKVLEGWKPFDVTGMGRKTFPPSKGRDGKVVVYTPVHGDKLQELRRSVVKAAEDAGAQWTDSHPEYKPHVTLAYVDSEDDVSDVKPVDQWTCQVQSLDVRHGDTLVSCVPFGTPREKFSERPRIVPVQFAVEHETHFSNPIGSTEPGTHQVSAYSYGLGGGRRRRRGRRVSRGMRTWRNQEFGILPRTSRKEYADQWERYKTEAGAPPPVDMRPMERKSQLGGIEKGDPLDVPHGTPIKRPKRPTMQEIHDVLGKPVVDARMEAGNWKPGIEGLTDAAKASQTKLGQRTGADINREAERTHNMHPSTFGRMIPRDAISVLRRLENPKNPQESLARMEIERGARLADGRITHPLFDIINNLSREVIGHAWHDADNTADSVAHELNRNNPLYRAGVIGRKVEKEARPLLLARSPGINAYGPPPGESFGEGDQEFATDRSIAGTANAGQFMPKGAASRQRDALGLTSIPVPQQEFGVDDTLARLRSRPSGFTIPDVADDRPRDPMESLYDKMDTGERHMIRQAVGAGKLKVARRENNADALHNYRTPRVNRMLRGRGGLPLGGERFGMDEGQEFGMSREQANDLRGRLHLAYPGVDVNLAPSGGDDNIHLSKIVVPKQVRNIGLGSRVMDAIGREADDTGSSVSLDPSGDFGGSVSRLRKFYRRFGFKKNKGGRIWASMLREPKQEFATINVGGRPVNIPDNLSRRIGILPLPAVGVTPTGGTVNPSQYPPIAPQRRGFNVDEEQEFKREDQDIEGLSRLHRAKDTAINRVGLTPQRRIVAPGLLSTATGRERAEAAPVMHRGFRHKPTLPKGFDMATPVPEAEEEAGIVADNGPPADDELRMGNKLGGKRVKLTSLPMDTLANTLGSRIPVQNDDVRRTLRRPDVSRMLGGIAVPDADEPTGLEGLLNELGLDDQRFKINSEYEDYGRMAGWDMTPDNPVMPPPRRLSQSPRNPVTPEMHDAAYGGIQAPPPRQSENRMTPQMQRSTVSRVGHDVPEDAIRAYLAASGRKRPLSRNVLPRRGGGWSGPQQATAFPRQHRLGMNVQPLSRNLRRSIGSVPPLRDPLSSERRAHRRSQVAGLPGGAGGGLLRPPSRRGEVIDYTGTQPSITRRGGVYRGIGMPNRLFTPGRRPGASSDVGVRGLLRPWRDKASSDGTVQMDPAEAVRWIGLGQSEGGGSRGLRRALNRDRLRPLLGQRRMLGFQMPEEQEFASRGYGIGQERPTTTSGLPVRRPAPRMPSYSGRLQRRIGNRQQPGMMSRAVNGFDNWMQRREQSAERRNDLRSYANSPYNDGLASRARRRRSGGGWMARGVSGALRNVGGFINRLDSIGDRHAATQHANNAEIGARRIANRQGFGMDDQEMNAPGMAPQQFPMDDQEFGLKDAFGKVGKAASYALPGSPLTTYRKLRQSGRGRIVSGVGGVLGTALDLTAIPGSGGSLAVRRILRKREGDKQGFAA